jgi:3-methyl-2-oxobutanoate hydroxymethyltransferase
MGKVTVLTLPAMKRRKEKITALTAYDFAIAKIVDEAGIDVILIGDSAANVIYGYATTLPISMEVMLFHTRAVSGAVKRALVVADMPFLSYQTSLTDAIKNAGLFLKEGAEAVKIEGGEPVLETVERLVSLGIPVMGHLGLTPQSINKFGGYQLRAKSVKEQKQLLAAAKKLEAAGCFSIVLEKIPLTLAKRITKALKIPTIGIGAGPFCDGQILVIHDLIGLFTEFKPKFVKRYAAVGKTIESAVKNYKKDVQTGKFPDLAHSFTGDEE